jgi:hypothetical protein
VCLYYRSPDPTYRPQARNLDVMLTEMSAEDASPVAEDNRANKSRTGNLYDIFPKSVAAALEQGKKVEPKTHDMVTVAFADIVSFADISRHMGPEEGKHNSIAFVDGTDCTRPSQLLQPDLFLFKFMTC